MKIICLVLFALPGLCYSADQSRRENVEKLLDKEIQDMIDFYSTDTGRSMVKKMPDAIRDSSLLSQEMVKDFFPKMQ